MKAKKVTDQFPNEGKVSMEAKKMRDDNYFKNFEVEVIRKKYIQFTVYMEALNEVLQLDRYSTVDQFAHRIRDLVEAREA